MLKKLLIAAVVVAVLLMVGLSFITAKYIDKEEILRVTQEREQLRKDKVKLEAEVAKIDSIKRELEAEVVILEIEADLMRADVKSLEKDRKVAQLGVRELQTDKELENLLMKAFPEIKEAMKITEVPVEEVPNMTIQHFSVPFRYAETFLIEHQNSENYKKQRNRLWELDTLQQNIIGLEKKIGDLEEQKSAEYQRGYDSAYVKYDDINKKYLALLNTPPTVEFGLPQIGAVAIGTVVGFVGGVALGAATK